MCVVPIDFFVFGFIVIGGACVMVLISLIDELFVAAKADLICCSRYLLVLGRAWVKCECGSFDGVGFFRGSVRSSASCASPTSLKLCEGVVSSIEFSSPSLCCFVRLDRTLMS